jgi:hypothetical protein
MHFAGARHMVMGSHSSKEKSANASLEQVKLELYQRVSKNE